MAFLSFRSDHLFVHPLAGALAIALGVYGLFARPLLVARAMRQVRYRIDERGVELQWSPKRRVLIPADLVPPFTVVPSGRAPAAAHGPAAAGFGTGPLSDVLFAGPSAWVSPWGVWGIVDDTWGLVCLDRPDEAVAALRQLRAASPTPTAWAVGVVTPPRVFVFVPWLRGLLHRVLPGRHPRSGT